MLQSFIRKFTEFSQQVKYEKHIMLNVNTVFLFHYFFFPKIQQYSDSIKYYVNGKTIFMISFPLQQSWKTKREIFIFILLQNVKAYLYNKNRKFI